MRKVKNEKAKTGEDKKDLLLFLGSLAFSLFIFYF